MRRMLLLATLLVCCGAAVHAQGQNFPSGGGGGTPGGNSNDIQCNKSSAFAPCGSASGAFTSNGAVINHTETGTFTGGSQNYFYNEFYLDSCNPATVNAQVGSIISESNYFYTDALSACTESPSGSGTATNDETNGLAGYAINNNSHEQGSFGGPYVVAGTIGSGYCIVSDTECEGAVQFALDTTSLSGVILVGDEVGMFPQNTGDTGYGFLASSFGSVQPSYDQEPAFEVHYGGIGTNLWTSGFNCETASLTIQNTYYSSCLELNPIASAAGKPSQSINFNDEGPSGAGILDGYLQQNYDNGSGAAALPRLTYVGHNGAVAGSFSAPSYIMEGLSSPVSGCSLSAQSGGAVGKFTSGTSGTCSVTITLPATAYGGWFCFAQDTTTTTDTLHMTSSNDTTCSLSGTTVSGDVIYYFSAMGF